MKVIQLNTKSNTNSEIVEVFYMEKYRVKDNKYFYGIPNYIINILKHMLIFA